MTQRSCIPCVALALLALASVDLLGCLGMSKELREHGVSAPAAILEVWDTGMTVNDNPVVGLKVRVQPADRPAFEATIKRTEISRIAVPQFQPGQIVPVRFDPKDPTQVAVDFEPPVAPTESSGNPYHDHFSRGSPSGAVFLPPPSSPDLYLGTADNASDTLALVENGYALIGGANAEGAPSSQQALEQGKAVGAAVVVVYGHFDSPADRPLAVVPFRPAAPPSGAGQPAALDAASLALVPALAPGQQFATYWGKIQPPILGVYTRPLDAREKARLKRKDGVVVDGVTNGSPAAAAHIALGDVIVAIDGRPVVDSGVQELLKAVAGRKVTIDLLRNGAPLAVSAQLNGAAP